MKNKTLKILDTTLCILMYFLAILSIGRSLALYAFIFSQLGCIWYFVTVNEYFKKYLRDKFENKLYEKRAK